MTTNRIFILLRLTLIIATAYLLLVESEFAMPQKGVLILFGLALFSNLGLSYVPSATSRTPLFGLALVTFDTTWITAALLYGGHFNAEFFFLYFFVILLAAIGENLALIALGALVVCVGYVYLMISSGETPSMWNSPSLIRIPFLFTTTAFYGYLIERSRSERKRAERHDTERERAESALSKTTQQLEVEAAVTAALAKVGQDMISSLDTPILLERVCQLTAERLQSDTSTTLFLQADEEVFQPVASFGLDAEARELAQVLKVPSQRVTEILAGHPFSGVVQVGAEQRILPTEFDQQSSGGMQILIPLRRGQEVIGVQVANWNEQRPPLTETEERIGSGIAQLASMALANARLVEELENANKLKSDFVASMSHELRTPLNLIIGYTDLLLDGTFGPVRPDQADTLQRVDRSARELLDLIEATLDLSRLEAKKVPLDLGDADVRQLLTDLRHEFDDTRTRETVDLIWNVPSQPTSICTDAVKLRMILKNLVGNALKFTTEGSITTTAEVSDDRIVFTVQDTGIGIALESQKVIFEPFRQADRKISGAYGGVGLGLYIVSRLVENMNGRITLQSKPGEGSTFRVNMPVDLKKSLSENVSTSATQATANPTELLLDSIAEDPEEIEHHLGVA